VDGDRAKPLLAVRITMISGAVEIRSVVSLIVVAFIACTLVVLGQ
jgi:hypothetical protein